MALTGLRLSLRLWLLLASLVSALPLLVFALYTTSALVHQHAAQDQAEMTKHADAVGAALRTRMDAASNVLQTMVTSEAGIGLDLLGVYKHARRVMLLQPDVVAITAVAPDGQQVFNTLRPFADPLPVSAMSVQERRVFSHGEVAYTPLYTGAVSGLRVMAVAVPLRDDPRTVYSLRMNLGTGAFSSVLDNQPWPATWTVAVLDPNGIIAARNRDAGRFVGQRATQPVLDAIARRNYEVIDSETKEGFKVRAAVRPIPGTDWFVAIGSPKISPWQLLWDSLGGLMLGGVMCLALGWLGALLIARRVGGQLSAAAAGGKKVAGSPVREIAELRAQADQSAEQAQQLTAQLSSAQRDALTGLPTRAVFVEHAARLLAQCPREHGCALLFMDLDGFKALNDRLGHQAGDDALVRVGQLLVQSTRGGDLCARLGGDEFVVLTQAPHEALHDQCDLMAQRLVKGTAALGQGLGASIGVAIAVRDQLLDDLLEAADQAMYAAKRAGRNTHRFY